MQDYREAPFTPERPVVMGASLSDRGRPQFLPPEEPSPSSPSSSPSSPSSEEPGLLPGMSEPSTPPMSPRAVLLGAAGVVVVLLVCGIVVLRSAGGTSPSVPALPKALGSDYTAVPDACGAVGKALPADVRPVHPRRVRDACTWELLRPDRSRSLEVEFQLEASEPRAGVSGSVKAARDFADDLDYSADRDRNGGFERDPERIDGLGDEAFAAQTFNLTVSGADEKTAKSYDMGGAQVEVRRHNVVLTVKWRGADYPKSVRGDKKLVGKLVNQLH
jgi:hypothetical protein